MTGPAGVILSVYLSLALNLPILTCYCNQTNWPWEYHQFQARAQFHQRILNRRNLYHTLPELNVHNREDHAAYSLTNNF